MRRHRALILGLSFALTLVTTWGNTVEIIVTDSATATSGSLSPCGRGPGRGGQGSTHRLVRGRGQAPSPLSLPSPARGEGKLTTGRLLGYGYFNGIATCGAFAQVKPLAAAQPEQTQPRPPVDAATRAMRREAEANAKQRERMFVKLLALPRVPDPALDVNVRWLARQQAEVALIRLRAQRLNGRAAFHNDGIVIWLDVIAARGEEPPGGRDEAEEGEEDDENQSVPNRRKIIVASESFDQCLFNGLTIDESRQRVKEFLESRIDRIDAVNRLSPEQKQKLRLAGKGDIKHLFDQIEAKRQQFEQVRADVDECRTLLRQLAPLREAYVDGPFGEGSLFIKTLWKIRRANELKARPPSR